MRSGIACFDKPFELYRVCAGKPVLTYTQKTWNAAGDPMHSETGYLRFPAANKVEMLISQPSGAVASYWPHTLSCAIRVQASKR